VPGFTSKRTHNEIAAQAIARGLHREVPPTHALVIQVRGTRCDSATVPLTSLRDGFREHLALVELMNRIGLDEWIVLVVFDRRDLDHSLFALPREAALEAA